MKRSIALFFIVCTMMCAFSCKKSMAVTNLVAAVEKMNEDCPQYFGFGTVGSVEYDEKENVVTFNYEVDCKKLNVDFNLLKSNSKQVRDILIIVGGEDDVKELVKMMADCDASLRLVFNDKGSSEKFECELSSTDLKEITDSKMSKEERSDKILDVQLMIAKSACPMRLDEVTTLVDVKREGNTIKYMNKVDESVVDMSVVQNHSTELKRSIRSQLVGNPASETMLSALKDVGGEIEYDYEGSRTGQTYVLKFSNREISEMIDDGNINLKL